MIPRKLLGSAQTPDKAGELQLSQRGDDFFIAYNGKELMNSRMHGSEDLLAEFACKPIARRPEARVLIGGLGLGYTLAAALAICKMTLRWLLPSSFRPWFSGTAACADIWPAIRWMILAFRFLSRTCALCLKTNGSDLMPLCLMLTTAPTA